MTGSNLMRVHDYLRAVASIVPFEKVLNSIAPMLSSRNFQTGLHHRDVSAGQPVERRL